ncbi:MAG TPA: hypothetical protein VHO01_08270 [Jatrophihabitans sp.]|nr:hypothetical protein [Jatrophihabitans sp.]
MSLPRLDQLHPPLVPDVRLGRHWGPRLDQQVHFRAGAGREQGLLLGFDPLWNEWAVLADPICLTTAQAAIRDVAAALGHHGVSLHVLALHARLRATTPAAEPGRGVML